MSDLSLPAKCFRAGGVPILSKKTEDSRGIENINIKGDRLTVSVDLYDKDDLEH
jgi:hypothetical protein